MVYVWADGMYVKAGLEDPKAALLVMIGALTNGQSGAGGRAWTARVQRVVGSRAV
ncbi:MAG TPA: hypothetical protein VLK82_19510 [Candidatus Tectomicrobia bacterium]|nr:hypothetical protein [Candidatus Tectomicrobia bacterium]